MFLTEGQAGDYFTLIEIQADLKIKKRLQDMGFTKGVHFKVMSFYSNNAFIINIRGTRVVIGKDIAGEILVEPSECNQCHKRHHHHVNGHLTGVHLGKHHKGANTCTSE